MKALRFIRNFTAFVGIALLVLAGGTEDWNMLLTMMKWGCVMLIPSVVYMAYEKVFGGEEY